VPCMKHEWPKEAVNPGFFKAKIYVVSSSVGTQPHSGGVGPVSDMYQTTQETTTARSKLILAESRLERRNCDAHGVVEYIV
jgi:hypothetical protein